MSDCKHYDREEVDFDLMVSKQLRKFVCCRNCKRWLFEIAPKENIV